MSERIFEEKSDGKLINQLRQLHAGLRTGAARLSAHMLHSSEPFPQRERSHSRRPALSPALRRAGMKRCADGERVRLSCWRRERERGGGRGAVRKATNEKRAKTQREKNQQAKAVLFIYLSPLRVFLGFVESRSSRRESGPRLRDFSLRELSRDVRDGLPLNPGTGFLDRTDAESVRKRSRTHYHEYSLSDGCCGRRLRRAEQESKADYLFCIYNFWPISTGFALLHAPHWGTLDKDSLMPWAGRPAQPMTAMFSDCNSSLHQKRKSADFRLSFLNFASIRKTDCSHASTRAVIHRTEVHACHLQQGTYHYFIC